MTYIEYADDGSIKNVSQGAGINVDQIPQPFISIDALPNDFWQVGVGPRYKVTGGALVLKDEG